MRNILISMIVPLYQGNKYLTRLLQMYESNCNNICMDHIGTVTELIIVNDSPENKILLPKKITEHNVITISNEKNVGIHASKINGLKQAQGEYVVFLDQDDLICPDFFKKQYESIGDQDAIVCNADIGSGSFYKDSIKEAVKTDIYKKGENGIISLGQMMIKRSSIPEEWYMDLPSRNCADDLFLIYMMILKERRIAFQNNILYYHTHTASNVSLDLVTVSESVIEIYKKLNSLGLVSSEEMDDVTKYRENQIQEYYRVKSQYTENGYRQRNVDIRTFNLYDRLLTNLEQGYRIDGYLKTLGISNVAIYGAGKMGEHFLNWMKQCETHVVCIIDKYKKGIVQDTPIIGIESAIEIEDEYEAIVVTPIEHLTIIKEISRIFKIPIYSMEEVVYNMKSIKYVSYL